MSTDDLATRLPQSWRSSDTYFELAYQCALPAFEALDAGWHDIEALLDETITFGHTPSPGTSAMDGSDSNLDKQEEKMQSPQQICFIRYMTHEDMIRQEMTVCASYQSPSPPGEGDFGEGASWIGTSAIGADPLILQPPSPPQAGKKGAEEGCGGRRSRPPHPYKNPPSLGGRGQGGWDYRNTNISSYKSTWHTKIYAKPGRGNTLLRQVY